MMKLSELKLGQSATWRWMPVSGAAIEATCTAIEETWARYALRVEVAGRLVGMVLQEAQQPHAWRYVREDRVRRGGGLKNAEEAVSQLLWSLRELGRI